MYTPQGHLPRIPTLTLIKILRNYLYCLAPSSSYYPPPCPPPLVDLCLLTPPLAYPMLHRPLPPMPGPLTPSPHLSPLCSSLHSPCLGTCHCSFNETAPYHCRGTKHESLGDLPLPYLSRRLDTIYIKTQVFRLLRYYSPAPRNIARSDWVTQNITHNMTSSIVQPYGLHSL